MIEEDDPIDTSITDEAPVETDDGSDPPITDEAAVETDDASDPPITELDIRMIAAELHDQGRGHVLVDMIEAATGVRPAEDAYSPRRLPIRDPEWRAARKKAERRKHRAERRARMTDEEKAKQIGNLQLWKAENPEKMQVAEAQRLEKKKAARKDRELVGVDLEGFDTGRYFTDDRPDYARELHEGIARGYAQDPVKQQEKLDKLLKDHIVISEEERLAQQVSFAGWTVHNAKWYLDQHDLSDDPIPSARNKLPGTPPIYIEHRPFLLGAGNDRHLIFIHEEMPPNSTKKIPVSGYKILNAIADLKKTFPNAIFIVFASGYDVSQILRCLDADTAGKLQAGEIVIKSVGIGRYCRAEVLQAYNWVRQMRPDMNEIQQSRMITLRGAWEFICPTIDDLTPAQLEAIKKNCPSARIGEDGLVYPFQYIKNYYDERAKYSKTDSRNWIIKFGINGAWGKTAQSVCGPRQASGKCKSLGCGRRYFRNSCAVY